MSNVDALMGEVTKEKYDKFFDAIEPFGWGSKTTNYKAVKKEMMAKFTREQINELNTIFHGLHNKLYNFLFDEVTGVGDDSYGDLINHIIGMGREEYEAVMRNPCLAQKRVNTGQFKESFSYAFPWDEDYEMLNKDPYIVWAKEIQNEYKIASTVLPTCAGHYELIDRAMESFLVMIGQDAIGPFTPSELTTMQEFVLAWEEKTTCAAKEITAEYKRHLDRLRVSTFVMDGCDPNWNPRYTISFFDRIKSLIARE